MGVICPTGIWGIHLNYYLSIEAICCALVLALLFIFVRKSSESGKRLKPSSPSEEALAGRFAEIVMRSLVKAGIQTASHSLVLMS